MADEIINHGGASDDDVSLTKVEFRSAGSAVPYETKRDPPAPKGCCWRFLCCCCAPRPPLTPNPGGSTTGGSGSGTAAAPAPVPKAAPAVTTAPAATAPAPASGSPIAQVEEGKAIVISAAIAAAPRPQTQPTETPSGQRFLLPPLLPEEKGKKCLVLDLDETLVHSSFKPIPDPDFVISIELDGVVHRVYVRKRPGVDNFLRAVGEKYEVVIFTASLAKYADPLLDILDRGKTVKTRLFREACVQHYGNYVKDLTHLGRPLEHCIIIDNSPFSYMFQPDNAIPISSWFSDKSDRQLYDLLPFLDSLLPVEDVATVLVRHRLTFNPPV